VLMETRPCAGTRARGRGVAYRRAVSRVVTPVGGTPGPTVIWNDTLWLAPTARLLIVHVSGLPASLRESPPRCSRDVAEVRRGGHRIADLNARGGSRSTVQHRQRVGHDVAGDQQRLVGGLADRDVRTGDIGHRRIADRRASLDVSWTVLLRVVIAPLSGELTLGVDRDRPEPLAQPGNRAGDRRARIRGSVKPAQPPTTAPPRTRRQEACR